MSQLKSHFINLIHLSLADDDLADAELRLLMERGELLGYSEEDVMAMIDEPEHENFVYPNNLNEIISCLYDITDIILADGIIHENEKTWFDSYLRKIGVNSNSIPKLISTSLECGLLGYDEESFKEKVIQHIDLNSK